MTGRLRNGVAIPLLCLALALEWLADVLKWVSIALGDAATRLMGLD